MRQIHVRDYGIIPGDEKETTLKLRKMLQEIRQEENLEIRFEKGIYHFIRIMRGKNCCTYRTTMKTP